MTLTRMFQKHPDSLVKLSFFFIQVKIIQVLDFDNWHPLKSRSSSRNAYMRRVMRKPTFCICENKGAEISFTVTAKLISAFVFATRIITFLYFLNPKFPAPRHLLSL